MTTPIHTQIKEARQKAGMSQQRLADLMDLPRANITRLESGKQNPTLNTLQCVANVLKKNLVINCVVS